MAKDEKLPATKKKNGDKSYYKLGIFYFNPDDRRPFPPKRDGSGRGVNWANPYAVALMLIIIAAIVGDAIYQIKKAK